VPPRWGAFRTQRGLRGGTEREPAPTRVADGRQHGDGARCQRAVPVRDGNVTDVSFHDDRGSQYLSEKYRAICSSRGIRQSAGRVATCFDNSVAEAFWSSLKRELVHRDRFATRAEARAAITAWIHRYKPSGCTRASTTSR